MNASVDLDQLVEHHRRGWRERLAGVAGAQPRDLVAELAFDGCPGLGACWRDVLRAPERWFATVAVAVGRVLPVAQGLLAADRTQLTRLLATIDAADEPEAVGALLADLHPRTQVSDGRWQLPGTGAPLSPGDAGLVVVPMLTTPERSMVALREQTVMSRTPPASSGRREAGGLSRVWPSCASYKKGISCVTMRKPAATSHRGVTREAVAEAAAALVASEGLEALSVRQVAGRLDVWPTTVIHHAGGRRDGLVELLLEHLAAGIRTEPQGDWRARLTALGHEIRRVALAHRGVADVLLRSGARGPQALRLADAILAALEDAGLDREAAPDAYDVFLTYVLGSAGRQTTATAPARWQGLADALDQVEPESYPALRRTVEGGAGRDDDERFAGGLALVLDAIAG
jgi:AcrR family transcriptional regulator